MSGYNRVNRRPTTVHRVVILTLADGCESPRTPVLSCRDALQAGGAEVDLVTAGSDTEIDEVMDGRTLVVASATDGQIRAVVRRLLRRYTPAASERPADLPADRTVPDLPAIGLLPLDPTGPDLVTRLGLPRAPSEVAASVLAGEMRRLDLLRNDGGSLTLDGALLGGADDNGRVVPFRAAVNVDDAVLSDGRDQLIAAVVANADGYSMFDGLPLLVGPSPRDGVLDVAIALAVRRRNRVEVEVRRGHGRAVAIVPDAEVPFLDDGVAGTLRRKRTWWMERGAWGVYVPA
jgi:hypothetical protein